MKKGANVNEAAKIKAFAKGGMSTTEIAIKLNIEEATVKSFIDYYVKTIKGFLYYDQEKPVKAAKAKRVKKPKNVNTD